jgi:hypothetical protein
LSLRIIYNYKAAAFGADGITEMQKTKLKIRMAKKVYDALYQ